MRKPVRTQCSPKGRFNEEVNGGFHTKVDEQVREQRGEQTLDPAPGKRQGRVAGTSTGPQLSR